MTIRMHLEILAQDLRYAVRALLRTPTFTLAAVLAMFSSAFAATGRVVVHVIDAGSGKPLPARLVLKTSDGQFPGDRIGCALTRWPSCAIGPK